MKVAMRMVKAFVVGNDEALPKWDERFWYIESERFSWTYTFERLFDRVAVYVVEPGDKTSSNYSYKLCCLLDKSSDPEKEILKGLAKIKKIKKGVRK